MFYPGQAVYIPDEKRLGIFLSFSPDVKSNQNEPYMFVYTFLGTDGMESDTQVYNPSDIRPISKADKKSVTGQSSYATPFQRVVFSRVFTEKEAQEMATDFLNEMSKLLSSKWFTSKYEVDIEVK